MLNKLRSLVAYSIALLLGAVVLGEVAAVAKADGNSGLNIITLSSRPDTVSGGTALVRVAAPRQVTLSDLVVSVNGQVVTSAFQPEASGRSLLGLVQGLTVGKNVLTVQALDQHNKPYLSGASDAQELSDCRADFLRPARGAVLLHDAAVQAAGFDPDTGTGARRRLLDRHPRRLCLPDHRRRFQTDAEPCRYPTDLAQTTTSQGKTVPYIVRVETGTINRGIYETAVLHDPTKEAPPTPFNPPAAWNHRLVYTLGGGCVGGWYIQGSSLGNGGILEDLMLRQGYGIAASTLNVYGNNCQDLLAAETLAMTRARFIENFGPVAFTIGYGCSGGTEASHPIADEYPGLLDGLVLGCSFPEVTAAMVTNITDADLFEYYLTHRTGLTWTDAQIEAATGYPTVTTLTTIGAPNAIRVKAQGGSCNSIIPKGVQYDAATNPTGIRCDLYDHLVNVFGRDPKTGFARRHDRQCRRPVRARSIERRRDQQGAVPRLEQKHRRLRQ